ncbi:MAG: type IX secretion system protein PorQ [Bacteroidia bacterium]
MVRILFLSILVLVSINYGFAQLGGGSTYSFLNVTSSARIAALGGHFISVKDNDLNIAFQNPALLNKGMHTQLALSGVDFADVKYGYAAYAVHVPKAGTFSAGIHFMSYGDFDAADATGLITGTFNASEYSFNLAYAKPLDSAFTIGTTLKTIYSHLESYTSLGLAADVGAVYHNPDIDFAASLVLKNMGYQLKSYREGNSEKLPFEVAFGVSKKLARAPFRFSLNVTNMQKWDLTYKDPAKDGLVDPLTQEPIEETFSFSNKLMRHFIFGVEFIPSQNFHIDLGYNYRRRQELKEPGKLGLSGFSIGMGFKVSKFHLSYGRAMYHLAGASNHISVTTSINHLFPVKSPE